MKWRVGVRYTSLYFDSQSTQSPLVSDASSSVVGQRETNSYWGVGPHAGLELAWNPHLRGLLLVGNVDATDRLGRIRQQYMEESATTASLLQQATGISSSQDVPSINGRLGLAWKPPELTGLRLFVGYEYEYWWNVGRLSLITARGELWDQGVVLQAQYDF
jgi:hypothetical protein